ncbi:hypothetical protein [Ideonella sp.]|uniref:hypothetical protein n=1 Tax=Ideonella sp. TaxID=1929293 RepID=UPI003BB506AA
MSAQPPTMAMSGKRWKAPMLRLAQRIDALSLRERAFVFISAAGLLLAAADQAVIADGLKAQAGWKAAQLREENELLQLRTELAKLTRKPPARLPDRDASSGSSPASANPLDLQAELRAARAAHEATLAAANPTPQGAEPVGLPDLLTRALGQQRGLTLVQLSTRPRSLTQPGAAAPSPSLPVTPPAVADLPLSTWQGASLSVAGSFADLRAFVAQLETSLPGLRWGTLTLDTASGTPVMTLNLWLTERAP